MTTEGMTGYGTMFRVETSAGSGVYTDLAYVTNVEPPNGTRDKIEITHYLSADGTKQYIPGLRDYAEIPLELNWVPGNGTDAFLVAWDLAGDTRSCQIEYSNGVKDTFPGYLASLTGAVPINDRMTTTANVQVAGARVRTP